MSSDYRWTKQINEIRYSNYIEVQHGAFINNLVNYVGTKLVESPFNSFEAKDFDALFFSAGNTILNFSASFTLFNTFILDIDIGVAYKNTLTKLLDKERKLNFIEKEQALFNEAFEQTEIQKYSSEARDLNAVLSTTFILKKVQAEQKRIKKLGEISKELSLRELENINADVETTLGHNQGIIGDYNDLVRSYINSETVITEKDYSIIAQNYLWPFTLLEQQRIAVAILEIPNIDMNQQGVYKKREVSKLSRGLSTLSWAIQGAIWGSKIGGWWGALIGFVVGGIAGYFMA